jgi:alcohol dehydrogenase class IV
MTRDDHRVAPSSPRQLRFCPRVLHGAGALAELPGVLESAEKYLVVTDEGISTAGLARLVCDSIAARGIRHEVFDRVHIDPDVAIVEEAVTFARRTACTAVIGLGGGSSLDAAKAVAARLAWPNSLVEYGRGMEVPAPIAPLVAIPTTAGTGSEATRVAVITDREQNEKMAIRGDALLPQVAVLDPDLLSSLPPRVAAECGADALTHAIEACVSKQASVWTDRLALAAIRSIGEYLPRLVSDPADVEAAEEMLLAANFAGQAFTHAGLGLVHSLGEPLGAFHHTSHGLSCALFLPVVMEYNLTAASPGYARIAAALGENLEGMTMEEAASASVASVRRLLARVGLPASYREANIDFVLRPDMVDQVFPQYSTSCNPRDPEREDVVRLFESLDSKPA